MPNLIEVQKNSYEWFLKEGLKEVFDDISPIADYSGHLSLEFVDFELRVVLYADTYAEDNWFLEICRDDADKGSAVRRLCQRVGADRLVVFGDNRNDIPLFREADLALCVANGSPEAKAAADRIIDSNTDEGVSNFLHAIYNRKV